MGVGGGSEGCKGGERGGGDSKDGNGMTMTAIGRLNSGGLLPGQSGKRIRVCVLRPFFFLCPPNFGAF